MRILDRESNTSIHDVILYLTLDEANELRDDLDNLINKASSIEHAHINDMQYEHEITVTIYDSNDLDGFDERSKQLIKTDK